MNVVYGIGNLGYCPFWTIIGDACYFLNINATEITDELSSAGVETTKISDDHNRLLRIQAARAPGNNIRIKIYTNATLGFIGIVPLRIKNTPFIVSTEADS